MADDWGCFNADLDVILGLVYPKMKGMTLKKVEALLKVYFEAGMLFLWQDGERHWGYFTSWNGHQFCNGTNLDDDGKQQRHRRKTPEPPREALEEYLNIYLYKKQVVSEKLEQFSTGGNISINPIPNPIPNPACADFERVWKAYPKKVSKGQAKKTWLKINPSEQLIETMLSTIERAKTSEQWQKDNGQYIPHLSTWLNAEGWEDDYGPPATTPEGKQAVERQQREREAEERMRKLKEQQGRSP